tara:strand:- start:1583 stop:1738 length:156 start_codon:yes stop_codon:yes gene_type:complete
MSILIRLVSWLQLSPFFPLIPKEEDLMYEYYDYDSIDTWYNPEYYTLEDAE